MRKPQPKFTNSFALILIIIIAVAVIAAVVIGGKDKPMTDNKASNISACGPYRKDKTVRIGDAAIYAEIPDNPDSQAKGLGGRPCILPDQGMLFVFPQPGQYAFWMKDMKFPIDILWISEDHRVVGQEIDVQPNTYPDRFINKKENAAKYVLELKSERSRELKVNIGTPVNF